MTAHDWKRHCGELLLCPQCGEAYPILLGRDVTVDVRVHPMARRGDKAKLKPTEPEVSALFHFKCQTALELRFVRERRVA